MNNSTFMKITNKDIYDMIKQSIEKQEEQHTEVCKRLDTTNGRVKLNRWISTTALTFCLVLLGFVCTYALSS